VSTVQPKYVIFSSGKDNSYGHPHKEVTDRFTAHNVLQKNTAESGSIFSVSDGVEVSFPSSKAF
jgi:competence protein ComEC